MVAIHLEEVTVVAVSLKQEEEVTPDFKTTIMEAEVAVVEVTVVAATFSFLDQIPKFVKYVTNLDTQQGSVITVMITPIKVQLLTHSPLTILLTHLTHHPWKTLFGILIQEPQTT